MAYQIPLWVYAAVMAASEGANIMSQRKIDKERAKAMIEERLKRKGLTRENEATADKSLAMFDNAREREDARAAELTKHLEAGPTHATTAAQGDARLLDPTSPPSATSTVDSARAGFADVQAKLAERAKAMGAAGSFGSVMQDYARGLQRNAQDIDMNSTTMQQWSERVLPARLEYANRAGREWSTTADILKLAATIMAPMALGKSTVDKAAQAAGESAKQATLAAPQNMFDPYSWQTWLKPNAAPRVSIVRPM